MEVPAERPDEAAPPVLSELTRADFEPRLEPGFGCTLVRDGADLIVAVSGDAVARIDGAVVDLDGAPADLNAMTAGGRYAGAGTTIDITLAPDLGGGDVLDEVTARPVRVVVTQGSRTERFDAEWACGS